MTFYYSASTRGFYSDDEQVEVPTDVEALTDDEYYALIAAQRTGKEIKPDSNGMPVAVDPVFVPVPNIAGFKAAMVTALGGIVATNELIKSYPVFLTSLSDMNWSNVEALVVDALRTNAIDQTQYGAFQTAFDSNNIPITLP